MKQGLFTLFEHCLKVKKSVNHNAAVLVQAPPKFCNVFNNVILVPPNIGSLIRAKNAITATNIEYEVNYRQKEILSNTIQYNNTLDYTYLLK